MTVPAGIVNVSDDAYCRIVQPDTSIEAAPVVKVRSDEGVGPLPQASCESTRAWYSVVEESPLNVTAWPVVLPGADAVLPYDAVVPYSTSEVAGSSVAQVIVA